ncbi:hypothetical protein EI94DRAFT_1108888 [Lactarius quietus]|nr:hypothetical protein EI94DRAFT_1108888 [Lactarius quietus]
MSALTDAERRCEARTWIRTAQGGYLHGSKDVLEYNSTPTRAPSRAPAELKDFGLA